MANHYMFLPLSDSLTCCITSSTTQTSSTKQEPLHHSQDQGWPTLHRDVKADAGSANLIGCLQKVQPILPWIHGIPNSEAKMIGRNLEMLGIFNCLVFRRPSLSHPQVPRWRKGGNQVGLEDDRGTGDDGEGRVRCVNENGSNCRYKVEYQGCALNRNVVQWKQLMQVCLDYYLSSY